MPSPDTNPFPHDPERHGLWEMLVRRDIEAFLTADWEAIAGDFLADRFFGLSGMKSANPDEWRMVFPRLEDYRDRWLAQARLSAETAYAEPRREALYRATSLTEIEISGERVVAHKKFDGTIRKADGSVDVINWQTLYLCARVDGVWKIIGFVGYLPNPMG
ncbi:hypothetical protein GCM10007874_07960 [Labrys miyagiensis]|uniref:Nuclear transport factor 2 family protein n=1 Tax=Labrys miyagiensis TaxID=346912 RepID=A0ABQ6CHP3_9HYPH|nr:hypothetical protein [Labrys miyagiensis]GLS17781.1 hypothetical protein GCM10007874_07960 [Labrys miyagiensis]